MGDTFLVTPIQTQDSGSAGFVVRRRSGVSVKGVTALCTLPLVVVGGGLTVAGINAHGRDRTADLIPGIVLLAGLVLLTCLVVRLWRHPPRVAVTPGGVKATNYGGHTDMAAAGDIGSIAIRQWTRNRSGIPMSVPFLDPKQGAGFWLIAMAAKPSSPTELQEQLQVLARIRATLGLPAAGGP